MEANSQNKLLRRFYEPLLVLHALDRTQGEHLRRPALDAAALQDAELIEQRRRYLDALSYACDFDKGGDSTTAVAVTMIPLTYHVACNKTPKAKVPEFLRATLKYLAAIYDAAENDEQHISQVLRRCVKFSARRLKKYRSLLDKEVKKCLERDTDDQLRSSLLIVGSKIDEVHDDLYILCLTCASLMKSDELSLIRTRVDKSRRQGSEDRDLANLRHYIGRIAYHEKAAKIMVKTAQTFPDLFGELEIEVLDVPLPLAEPSLRKSIDLNAVANRMFPQGSPDRDTFQERLAILNHNFKIKDTIDTKLSDGTFKPIVHAELVLLEHLYQGWNELQFFDDDRYIGCSKPACYCCFLYFKEHPGSPVTPASHQKIYVNWLPPTRAAAAGRSTSMARHELDMLNKMNVSLRKKLVEQVMQRSGRRGHQHDTVTDDTATNVISRLQEFPGAVRAIAAATGNSDDARQPSPEPVESLDNIASALSSLDLSLEAQEVREEDADADSDAEGGVSLS